MSQSDDCFKAIKAALPGVREDALRSVLKELDGIRSTVFEKNENLAGPEFRKRAMEFLDNYRYEVQAQKKQLMENLLKTQKNLNFAKQGAFSDNPAEGVMAMLGGTGRYSQGGNSSVSQVASSLTSSLLSGTVSKLKEANLFKAVVEERLLSGEIRQELGELKPGGNPGISKSPQALEAAKIIKGQFDRELQLKQQAGSAVRRLEGYMGRQAWDSSKVGAVPVEDWIGEIYPLLDQDKTFGTIGTNREKLLFLQDVYKDIVRGSYDPDLMKPTSDKLITAGGISKNVDNKMASSRTLHFNDGMTFDQFNSKYGTHDLVESLVAGARRTGRQVALMDRLGTDPEGSFAGLIKRLSKSDPEVAQNLKENDGKIQNLWKSVKGDLDIPGTSMGAKAVSNVLAIQSMAKLGSAVLHLGNDLAGAAASLRAVNGKNLFENVHGLTSDYFSMMPAAERSYWASRFETFKNDYLGEAYSRFGASGDSSPGVISDLQRKFFSINGVAFHDEIGRLATIKQHAMKLAEHAGKPFDSLEPRMQAELQRYNLTGKTWETLGRAVEEAKDGSSIMTPEALRQIPAEAFENGAKGKFDAEKNLLAYLHDHGDMGIPLGNARTKAFMLQGTKADDAAGMFWRLVGQFKSYPLNMARIGERILLSNPVTQPRNLSEAILKGKGDINGMAQFIVFATALGYAGSIAGDLAKGKTPAAPEASAKGAFKLLADGGGMGIYGDFLFGEFDRRYGRSALQMVAGPTLGQADDFMDLWSKAREGNPDASRTFKLAMNNVPFHNLFYTKVALDNLIVNHVGEALKTGYISHKESQENAQMKKTPGLFTDHQERAF